jgi:hypothetical protein
VDIKEYIIIGGNYMTTVKNFILASIEIILYFLLSWLGGMVITFALFLSLSAETLDKRNLLLTKKVKKCRPN